MKLSDVIVKIAKDVGLMPSSSLYPFDPPNSVWLKIKHPDSDVLIHVEADGSHIIKLPIIVYSYKDYRRAAEPSLAKRTLVCKPGDFIIDIRAPNSLQSLRQYFLNIDYYLKQQGKKIAKIEQR